MRDNFTKQTVEILAKRVGYICSNPNCAKHTVGPNTNVEKATIVGIAAHITAASANGPRFNPHLAEAERKYPNNGIWLCSNCSIMIDRDVEKYTREVLELWKNNAEESMANAIEGKKVKGTKPYLEAEIIWSHYSRAHNGYSSKNLEVFEQPIPSGTDLYVHWCLRWSFSIVIHNNSETPAYNLQLSQLNNGNNFTFIEELPKVNNLQPFQSRDLEAKYEKYFHGTSEEADIELTIIPKDLIGLLLELKYTDNERTENVTIIIITENGIESVKTK